MAGTQPYAIALVGFTDFERSTFVSFFRLATKRVPGYAVVDDADASDLIIANADDSKVMGDLLIKPPRARVLLVGEEDYGTGWRIEPRPIKLMGVLNAVDQILNPQAAETAPAAPAPRPRATFAQTHPAEPVRSQPAAPLAGGAALVKDDDGILVVDDSETALQYMRQLLGRVGFGADLAKTAEQALEKLKLRPYRIIFMDVMLEGMDGYQACKLIKQRKYDSGKPPVVVMLTSKAGAIDKIKGSMAGCDAYLVKPAEERALLKLLAKYDDQVQRSFQATRLGRDADRDAG